MKTKTVTVDADPGNVDSLPSVAVFCLGNITDAGPQIMHVEVHTSVVIC